MATEFNDVDRGTPLENTNFLLNLAVTGKLDDALRDDFPCTLCRLTYAADSLALGYANNHEHETVIGDEVDNEFISACVELCIASGNPVPVSGPFTGALLAMLMKIIAEQIRKWLEDRLS